MWGWGVSVKEWGSGVSVKEWGWGVSVGEWSGCIGIGSVKVERVGSSCPLLLQSNT